MVNFHFVFCPKYRCKTFLVASLENRFKELVYQICKSNDYVVLALECHIDHVHLFVNAAPNVSAAEAIQIIKANTSRVLLKEF